MVQGRVWRENKGSCVRTLMNLNRENHRSAWTPEQTAELMRLSRQNLTAQQIAHQLGRTEEAVQLRAQQMGLALNKSQMQG